MRATKEKDMHDACADTRHFPARTRTAFTCTFALHVPHLLSSLSQRCVSHTALSFTRTVFTCTFALHVLHLLSSHTVVYHTRHFPAPTRTTHLHPLLE